MAYTDFHITGGSAKSDTNGGGPNLGTNDGPIYALSAGAAGATVAAGTPTVITDLSGNNWSGCAADDFLCWDTGGVKEFRRIVSITGADATVSAACTAGAEKAVNVGGAWSTDLALTFITTAYVNAAGDPPRLNIKSNASITFSAARTTNNGTITIPITLEGYNNTVGDLAAESWATSHTIGGWLTLAGYPLLTGNYTLVIGQNNIARCLYRTGNTQMFAILKWSHAFRLAAICTGNNHTAAQSGSTGYGSLSDCEFISKAANATYSALDTASGTVTQCRFAGASNVGLECWGTNIDVTACVFCDLTTGLNNVQNAPFARIANCTFDRVSGVAVAIPDYAYTGTWGQHIWNSHFANCGTVAKNLGSASRTLTMEGRCNRILDCTNQYVGFHQTALPGDVTTDTGTSEQTDYTLVATGTATAGAAGTITLAVGSSATNNYYRGCFIKIISGTGTAGDVRYVDTYDGATRVATMTRNWTSSPGNDTVYELYTLYPAATYPGRQAGIPNTTDIGAFQRAEDYPAVANVLTSDTTDGTTGTFDEAARNTDPGEANVKTGTAYKIQNVSKTGTYAASGGGGRIIGA